MTGQSRLLGQCQQTKLKVGNTHLVLLKSRKALSWKSFQDRLSVTFSMRSSHTSETPQHYSSNSFLQ